MENRINCPDCNGKGCDDAIDIQDYVKCPTCGGTGKVEVGTKSWIQKLFESNE